MINNVRCNYSRQYPTIENKGGHKSGEAANAEPLKAIENETIKNVFIKQHKNLQNNIDKNGHLDAVGEDVRPVRIVSVSENYPDLKVNTLKKEYAASIFLRKYKYKKGKRKIKNTLPNIKSINDELKKLSSYEKIPMV